MKQKERLEVYQNNSVKISVRRGWCKSCGICIEFCPKNVLVSDNQGKPIPENIDACINCSLCELRCPDFAIVVEGAKEKDE
jgi:2-oxoglutarate ferredoxin oxidoreductase subunit delta